MSELIIFDINKKIKYKIKENERKEELFLKSYEPIMLIEKITIKKDFRSSVFDGILDDMNFPKSYDKIKEKLKLKRIMNWKIDIEKIFQGLDYNSEYMSNIIEYLEELEEFNFFELRDISEIIPKENRYYVYQFDSIYRVIETDEEMYIMIILKKFQTRKFLIYK